MKKRFPYYVRTFLNKPGHQSIAYVYATVEKQTWGENVTLLIGDCGRQISLEVSRSANDLHKLDKLIQALAGLRAYLSEKE